MAGIIGGELGYRLLRAIGNTDTMEAVCDEMVSTKIEVMLGPDFWPSIAGKTVIDFGCGYGNEAIALAHSGARAVIGLDIREEVLEIARNKAELAGLNDRIDFTTSAKLKADVIVSLDAFEHFDQPDAILVKMRELLTDDGRVFAAFGPTWYHPLGGHLFSIFPFAHLVFTESALIRWRSDFKTDGATRFSEVAGGLNQMTISRFIRIVEKSPFKFYRFEAIPIKRLRWLASRPTREFTTSIVRCELVPR